MPKEFNPEQVEAQMEALLTPEARQWLADLLHDHLGGRITNLSLQAEIILRAWEVKPEMALEEMQALKHSLDGASHFLVALVRLVTPSKSSE